MNIFSRKKKKKDAKPPEKDINGEPRPPRTTTITPREDNRWRGLTPPPDRRTPGTEVITPELPPPGPLFRPERGPRAIGMLITCVYTTQNKLRANLQFYNYMQVSGKRNYSHTSDTSASESNLRLSEYI